MMFLTANSYFFEKLAGTYSDLSNGKPAERLKTAQTNGTDTPFDLLSEDPQEE